MPTVPPQQATPSEGPNIIPPSSWPRQSPRLRQRNRAHFAATDTAVVKATKLIDEANEEFVVIELPKHLALKAINPDTGLGAECPELHKSSDGLHWEQSFCNQIGRLFQGYREIKGTNNCRFMHRNELPPDRKAPHL